MARKEKIQVVVPEETPETETPAAEEQQGEVVPGAKTPAAVERNRSAADSPVELVWKTCDEMEGARRKDVVEACIVLGVNVHTARTQYQRWFTENKKK